MKRFSVAAVLLAGLLFLSGCSTWVNLMSTMGFSVNDYAGEKTVAVYEADSEEAATVLAMVRRLLIASPVMTEFSGAGEAFDAYRDAVLNSLLRESYGRYTGNRSLLEKAEKAYPGYEITTLIPVSDFESAMYTLFGGSWKITNQSGVLFNYLEKADGYTCVTSLQESAVETEFVELLETENTFRLTFRNRLEDETSPLYEALLIKRQDDGPLYFRSLKVKAA